MNYWWASQGNNYAVALAQGTLWSHPRIDKSLPADRIVLKSMAIDDVVFHYEGPALRAISRVVATWLPATRPAGYPRNARENETHDEGWLVRVEPLVTGLSLNWHDFDGLIQKGAPGPLDVNGEPQQKYVSRISDDEAERLLAHLDITLPSRSFPGRPNEDWTPRDGETDAEAVMKIRLEQGALRAYLLRGRTIATCALCGHELPRDLLVAGHIVKRSKLADHERNDFDAIAMLVCTIGCDALFENGYLAVDETGTIVAGREPATAHMAAQIAARVGQPCAAWNTLTAARFQVHHQDAIGTAA